MKDLKVNEKLKNLLSEKRALVACHRGAHGGNIIQNTAEACLAAYALGADIAEFDVVRSSDGGYYVFHDTEEPCSIGILNNLRNLTSEQIDRIRLVNKYGCLTSQKIPKLSEVLKKLKGKGLINMDRCWGKDFEYTVGALEIIASEGMTDSVIVKSNFDENFMQGLQAYGKDVMYMAIVSSVEEIEKVEKFPLNTVGFELLFKEDGCELVKYIPRLREKGYLVWGNSITLNDTAILSGGHDDIGALLESKDKHWGWLVDAGFNVLQTDFPQALSDYIKQKM
ncbi:MAG: glycerophosphodiester phosphodiesterase family protein [Clostridia bacterium]|nr:glycerophosphodiester phosphodiesterase family protein [Clostridia bacterium]